MSKFSLQNPPEYPKYEINNSSGNYYHKQIPSKILNQKQIINSTRTKKIIISKNNNDFQYSPKRIIYTNKIYNNRMESPTYTKVTQKYNNKINSQEEEKADNHSYKNIIYKKNENDIIYNKDDFNNNKFYQKKLQNEYHQKEKSNNYKKIITYDLLKNKKLLNYNSNYKISPKKDSKILLKSVICSPVSVHYTEIKDAELKLQKEYIEKTEEIEEEEEITIKNKIINIWSNTNKVIKNSSFSLISEEVSDKYEKKIEELNEIISNLMKEKEQNQNKLFFDNIIQSFNFKLKGKNIKKEKLNENVFLNIEEIKINPDEFKQPVHSQKSSNEFEKINDIIIPGQKKKRFSFDKIYGQELCILSNKKKKNILKINHRDSIQIFEKKEKFPLKINSIEEICLSGDEYFLNKEIENKIEEELKYEKNDDFCI